MLNQLSAGVKQYLVVTGNYWAFTLTDGALRMLVVLYFHQLGYAPLQIAMLFLFYEFFGVVTNLVGGWLGARLGLNRTMNIGLGLQIVALVMLLVPAEWLTVAWMMVAQALSGIAKDLNKMSAKSAIKTLLPENAQGRLYHWVALLTGSKNALKGFGFFLGALLLTWLGFAGAILALAVMLTLVWLTSLFLLKQELGRMKDKPRFTDVFSKSRAINVLSLARFFLFAARDVWFVVALPVYLSQTLGWSFWQVGGFMASWVVAYGLVQALAPRITGKADGRVPGRNATASWGLALAITPLLILLGFYLQWQPDTLIITGLLLFGLLFAVNSSVHSFLIVSHARSDGVSLDVGFYYMANAMGRLIGTLLSGYVFQVWGLTACLWISALFILLAALIALALPKPEITNTTSP